MKRFVTYRYPIHHGEFHKPQEVAKVPIIEITDFRWKKTNWIVRFEFVFFACSKQNSYYCYYYLLALNIQGQ